MRKRSAVILGIVALVVMLVLIGWRWLAPPLVPGVTVENFRRLHGGMTEAEIEAILGEPGKSGPDVKLTRLTTWEKNGIRIQLVFPAESAFHLPPKESMPWQGWLETADGEKLNMAEPPRSFQEWLSDWINSF
jgi:hypothetical protein